MHAYLHSAGSFWIKKVGERLLTVVYCRCGHFCHSSWNGLCCQCGIESRWPSTKYHCPYAALEDE